MVFESLKKLIYTPPPPVKTSKPKTTNKQMDTIMILKSYCIILLLFKLLELHSVCYLIKGICSMEVKNNGKRYFVESVDSRIKYKNKLFIYNRFNYKIQNY